MHRGSRTITHINTCSFSVGEIDGSQPVIRTTCSLPTCRQLCREKMGMHRGSPNTILKHTNACSYSNGEINGSHAVIRATCSLATCRQPCREQMGMHRGSRTITHINACTFKRRGRWKPCSHQNHLQLSHVQACRGWNMRASRLVVAQSRTRLHRI